MLILLLALLAFLSSVYFTHKILEYSLAYRIIDTPNSRSLHEAPIPRGGGLVIVIYSLCTCCILYYKQVIEFDKWLSFSFALILTASVAYLDDWKGLSIKFRMLIYWLSSVSFLFFIQTGWHTVFIFIASISFVWMVNLYNFMDGVDGLAAIQAMTALLFGIYLFHQFGATELVWICTILCSAVLGFLYWNWSPAKIFLGDVGSCSLGLCFSMIAVWSYLEYQIDIIIWLLLLSVFIADATFTLIYRILKKEKWLDAHNTHAYQILAKSGCTHRTVASLLLLYNILIIWPMAYSVLNFEQYGFAILIINYTLLFFLWCKLKRVNFMSKKSV